MNLRLSLKPTHSESRIRFPVDSYDIGIWEAQDYRISTWPFTSWYLLLPVLSSLPYFLNHILLNESLSCPPVLSCPQVLYTWGPWPRVFFIPGCHLQLFPFLEVRLSPPGTSSNSFSLLPVTWLHCPIMPSLLQPAHCLRICQRAQCSGICVCHIGGYPPPSKDHEPWRQGTSLFSLYIHPSTLTPVLSVTGNADRIQNLTWEAPCLVGWAGFQGHECKYLL